MMKTSDSTNACPRCGAPVTADAPQGLCPKCVLGQAAAPEAAPTATVNIPSLERLAVAFPQLQVLELIGRGGMGFVFKARQPHLDRFVALKLLPDSLAHDPHFAERFNREGRTLARLNHPNIVGIFDFGQAGGFYFLLMEYVDGVNLRQAMQAGKFSPSEALAIVPKICEALQFAHEEGVLHRDIKPENILLDAKGRVKIADFGIAKIVGEDAPGASLTATGAALGTPHYMAPDQFEKPGSVDHRADIYSLGVVFYEMLTGELPIGRFSPPSQRTPVDPRVDDVVMRTLEKEREKRFQSAGEMKSNVEHLTDTGAGTFKAAPPRMSPRPEGGSHGTMVINPGDVVPSVPAWSKVAIVGAVLTGLSFLMPLLVLAAISAHLGEIAKGSLMLASVGAFAVAGTVLGWMALSDIRSSNGTMRGLPLAVFAAMAWPLLLLLTVTLGIPFLTLFYATRRDAATPFWQYIVWLVPVGTLTFSIWSVYAAARWGANQPPSKRRGVLKWIFAGVMVCALGVLIVPVRSYYDHQLPTLARSAKSTATPPVNSAANGAERPWIGFTFTAVELREVAGVRWLAIDYLDDVHGEAQKAFPWEATIPGFKPETRTSEFLGGDKGSPPVRHQRAEYRMPDSVPRGELEKLRDNVAKGLNQRSFRLGLGERKLLFEFATSDGGTIKAWLAVMPPLKATEPKTLARYQQVTAQLEILLTKEQQLLQSYTAEHPVVQKTRRQIEDLQQEKARLEKAQ
jgi:predicted Ser/Thr protein kinase